MVVCRVTLLDGTTFEPKGIDRNSTGQVLFDKVCRHLDLIETDYFGLTYRDKSGKKFWSDNSKKISKQLKGGTWVFEFQVKFYPPDPLSLTEGLTRYQLCLQIRVDIFNGKLPCSFVTYALLGSYTVQSELSDYDSKELGASTDYLQAFDFAPTQSQELLDKISELHKQYKGQTPAEADANFLENAKKLAMYGVDLHDAKDSENKDIVLGVCASGILVYKDRLRINRFVWPKILKLTYKRNNFYIKLRPGEFEPHERTIGFRLENHKLAKRLWKTCVEHHAFFRLKMSDAPDTGTLFPRFNTRFRYSGRTAVQAKKAAEASGREEPHITRTAERRSLVKEDKTKAKSVDDVSRRKNQLDNDNYPDESDRYKDKGDPNATAARHAPDSADLVGKDAVLPPDQVTGKEKKKKDKKGGAGLLARFTFPRVKDRSAKRKGSEAEAPPLPREQTPPPPSPPTPQERLEQETGNEKKKKDKKGGAGLLARFTFPRVKDRSAKRKGSEAEAPPLPREQTPPPPSPPTPQERLEQKSKIGMTWALPGMKELAERNATNQTRVQVEGDSQITADRGDNSASLDTAEQARLDELFDRWDNDRMGWLDADEVHALMRKYKDGLENKTIDKARKDMSKKSKGPQDHRLSKDEFAQFVVAAAAGMHEPDSVQDFSKFLHYHVSQRQSLLDQLYGKWDSGNLGSVDEGEVELEMKKFRDGQENKAIDKAKKDFHKNLKPAQENRVNKREFCQFVTMTADTMHGGVDTFEDLVKFLYHNIGDRQAMLDDLFRKWDSDGSGYLDQGEVEAVMKKYKDGQENKAIDKAKKDLQKKKKHPDDPQINKQEFSQLVSGAADSMHDPQAFKDLIAFLNKNAGERKMLLDNLFRKWDSDGSGYVDQGELEAVMKKYKDGQENKAIDKAKKDLQKKKKHPDDPRINTQEFSQLVSGAADSMHDPQAFQDFVAFLVKNAGERKMLLDNLFRKWDSDGSGYVDQGELEAVMKKYKDGQENKAIDKAKKDLQKKKKHPDDPRINKQEFSQLVSGAADSMHDPQAFQDFVAFLDKNAGERKMLLDNLFRKWDSDGSGYLDQGEVEAVMKKYKDGQENKAIDKAKKDFNKRNKHPDDPRLNQQEFRQLVAGAADCMHDPQALKDFVAFLEANAGERKWLLDDLFRKWDSDGSGYLDQGEVEAVMKKFKDGQENKAIDKAKKDLNKKKKHPDDPRINKQEFSQLVAGSADSMQVPDAFKAFVTFLANNTGERKLMLDDLFRKWDSDDSGYLDQGEVEAVMKKYKDGQENKAIDKANKDLTKKKKHPDDPRINKQEFSQLVIGAADGMQSPDAFMDFVAFLHNNVGRRKLVLDDLFRKWDTDGTGRLDQHEVEGVMKLYKDGEETKAIEKAKVDMNKTRQDPENKFINKPEFNKFVTLSAHGMKEPDSFDNFVEFLDHSVDDGTRYQVQLLFIPGMAPGDTRSIDRRMEFMPIVAPDEFEDHHKHDEPMPFFEPPIDDDDSKRVPPQVAKKPRRADSEEERVEPPTVKTERFKYNPDLDEIPMSTSNIPIVETKTHTVTYERDGIPYETEDSILISAHSVTTKSQTIDTTTYKTEKDGVIETRVERKITVVSDENEEFDHDALLRAAIEEVTEMNPELYVERIECMRQIEEVTQGDTAV